MSIVEYHRCDMCGEIIINEAKMGYFQGAMWPEGESAIELCEKCSEKVQMFTRNHKTGMEDACEA